MQLEEFWSATYEIPGIVAVDVGAQGPPRQVQAEGGGVIRGPRVAGKVEWICSPFVRDDGVFTPNMRALLKTSDGARIRFQTLGYSLPPDPGTPYRRLLNSVRFYSSHASYRWLNHSMAIEEGVLDTRTGIMETRAFLVAPDFHSALTVPGDSPG